VFPLPQQPSLDCVRFESLPILPGHPHFFPSKASILDRHAEERVFVLLVVGGKGVLVEQHQFRVIRARFCEFRKLRSDGRDQAGLTSQEAAVAIRDRIFGVQKKP
jgi:hypothetical protein